MGKDGKLDRVKFHANSGSQSGTDDNNNVLALSDASGAVG